MRGLHPSKKQEIRNALNRTNCERCNISFKQIPKNHCHIHHKDHNKYNNTLNNFELLCLDCHMKEHKTGNKYNKGRKFPTLRRFSIDEESEICEAFATTKFSTSEIANYLGCNRKTILQILKNFDPEIAGKVKGIRQSRRVKRSKDGRFTV